MMDEKRLIELQREERELDKLWEMIFQKWNTNNSSVLTLKEKVDIVRDWIHDLEKEMIRKLVSDAWGEEVLLRLDNDLRRDLENSIVEGFLR